MSARKYHILSTAFLWSQRDILDIPKTPLSFVQIGSWVEETDLSLTESRVLLHSLIYPATWKNLMGQGLLPVKMTRAVFCAQTFVRKPETRSRADIECFQRGIALTFKAAWELRVTGPIWNRSLSFRTFALGRILARVCYSVDIARGPAPLLECAYKLMLIKHPILMQG